MEILKPKKLYAAAAMATGSIALVACGDSGPDVTKNEPAIVREHVYDDADTWYLPISTGKTVIMVPQFDPEHYYLVVEQCGHDEFNDKSVDGCGLIEVEVDQSTYAQYDDGSTIVFSN